MEAVLYEQFDRLEDAHWWFSGRRAVVREVLRRRLPRAAGLSILDVGCGTGGMLQMLRDFGTVSGMDTSEQALASARQRLGPDVPLRQGQLPDGLPPGQTFDLVTAFDVIEHIPDAPAALAAIRGALAPGGALVVTVPAYQFLWSRHDELNHHCRRYTAPLLRRHLEAGGFKMAWHSYFNTLLFPPAAAVRLLQKVLPGRRGGGEGSSDLDLPPRPINRLLEMLFAAERFVVPRARVPFGVSLVAVAHPAG